jgi:hypothetical protein
MKPIPENQKSLPHPTHPPVADNDKLAKAKAKAKAKAEEREVAGMHKNDGQKDHKGAR